MSCAHVCINDEGLTYYHYLFIEKKKKIITNYVLLRYVLSNILVVESPSWDAE